MMRASRMQFGLVLTAAFAAAVMLAAPVSAQGRLSLSERLARLEAQSQAQGTGQTTVELLNRLNELQSELQSLRGLIEQQTFEIDTLKKTVRDRYVDIDSRVARLEGGGSANTLAPAPAPIAPGQFEELPGTPAEPGQLTIDDPALRAPVDAPPMAAPPPVNAPSEKAAYDDAFAALRDGRYAESARRFQTFLEQFPNGDLTDNALYWLGESYYVTQNYRVALETFTELLTRFPQSSKAPDALLKTGYCQYELKDWGAAERALNEVVQRYPDTTVARLAQGRLRALNLEGQR